MAEEITAVPAPERSSIAETGSITAHTARGTVHCITIVGQIEGHMELPAQNKTTKYEHLIPQIAAVEQSEDIDGLLVLLLRLMLFCHSFPIFLYHLSAFLRKRACKRNFSALTFRS